MVNSPVSCAMFFLSGLLDFQPLAGCESCAGYVLPSFQGFFDRRFVGRGWWWFWRAHEAGRHQAGFKNINCRWVHCRTGSSETVQDGQLSGRTFTAAQAAQKKAASLGVAGVMFTAAQAAQKKWTKRPHHSSRFTAAQAAQKSTLFVRSYSLRVHCRTGSSENQDAYPTIAC